MKVAFLDRDGTIVRDYPDEEWRGRTEPEFLDGSIEGSKALQDAGYHLIIITNQYIIGEGHISIQEYEIFTQKLLHRLHAEGVNILDIFYCPHSRNDGCSCCKPAPGLIEQAIAKYPIDLSLSLFVGDSISDQKLAQHFGLSFYGIGFPNKNHLNDLREIKKFIAKEVACNTNKTGS